MSKRARAWLGSPAAVNSRARTASNEVTNDSSSDVRMVSRSVVMVAM